MPSNDTRYPWDRWLKRRTFTLTRHFNYACAPYVMAQQIRNAAYARGKKVSISINGDLVTATVLGDR